MFLSKWMSQSEFARFAQKSDVPTKMHYAYTHWQNYGHISWYSIHFTCQKCMVKGKKLVRKRIYPLKLTSLGHSGAWGPPVQPRGACPSASSRVPSGAPLSPDPRARCLSTADTRTDTLQYIELINIRIAEFDKWWFNAKKHLSHSSHWLMGVQEESPLHMSMIWMNSKTWCFNKTCCVDHDKEAWNHDSWTSRKLWRGERDL